MIYYSDSHYTLTPVLSNKKCAIEVSRILPVHAILTDVYIAKKFEKVRGI